MKTLVALTIAGMLVLGLFGLAFKLLLGRYALAIVLAFFGITFVVTFLAFAFVILRSPRHTSEADFEVAHENTQAGRGRLESGSGSGGGREGPCGVSHWKGLL